MPSRCGLAVYKLIVVPIHNGHHLSSMGTYIRHFGEGQPSHDASLDTQLSREAMKFRLLAQVGYLLDRGMYFRNSHHQSNAGHPDAQP